jgi:hypothetical protein
MIIRKYTTELSKGQGMIPETLALLQLWEPSMSVAELKSAALKEGVIGRATALRVQDIVGRVFASRYLRNGAKPALNLKRLLELGITPNQLNQVFFVYTARAHDVLHDFITDTYWSKYAAGAAQITRQDALDFLERATNNGIISPRWSETMMLRVARYLTGCLTDFQLTGDDHGGRREIIPFKIQAITTLVLAHDIHFSDFSDNALLEHEDWRIFGLEPVDVKFELDRVAGGHFIPQFSGDLMRITWNYKTMEEALGGIAAAELR